MFAAKNQFLAAAKILKTVTFGNGATIWTTPADVNLIVSVSGKGQDSYAGTWPYDLNGASSLFGSMTDTGWTDYSSLYSYFTGRLSAINLAAPLTRSLTNIGTYFVFFNTATNTLWALQNGSGLSYAYGTATLNWTLPTSGAITTSINGIGSSYNWSIQIPYYVSGAATTAFGQTFSGGVGGGTATLTTFTNIAVTPSTSYSIVNTSSDATVVTVSYYSAY